MTSGPRAGDFRRVFSSRMSMILYSVTVLLLQACLCSSASAFDASHKLFSKELSKYVHDGAVDYSKWKKDRAPLDQYLDQLKNMSSADYKALSEADRKALWLNAYNAYTIKLVLEHYPIKGEIRYYPADSIRQIDGFWEKNPFNVSGKNVTLEEIEHNILRKDFRDPRLHFAVVCAAKGCAKIRKEAFTGSNVEELLASSARDFVTDPAHVKFSFDKKEAHISKLFSWFPLDFVKSAGLCRRVPPPTDDEIVLTYILRNSPPAVLESFGGLDSIKEYNVVYDEYDWGLNDWSTASAKSITESKRK